MELPKIHSITKKLLVALVGGFLLLFLLFHMTANLFILRHDDGAWYSAFCHFMGTNWVVKIFEVVLLGVVALHILLTLWLVVTNRLARPTRYHQRQRSKTHTTSKLMMWTGILIFAFLVMHFCQFWFVKVGLVKGDYMVEVEKLQTEEVSTIMQYSAQNGMEPADVVAAVENQMAMYADQLAPEQMAEMEANIQSLKDAVPVAEFISKALREDHFSQDRKWIRHISYDERQMLKEKAPKCGVEPDFYYMSRNLFHNGLMVLLYLIAFVALFMHLTHAFPSVFQTLGLNNYTYNGIIEILGKIYTWVITLGFAAVPILVFLGL
ncbi:MAG: succinate dehydrogenase cytochrome b subunit [Bacteroidales bacterium]|nr:succinate dehydrogenase cytochrome b subunit [Bacteroidales bacterium]